MKYTKPRGTEDIYNEKCEQFRKFEQICIDIGKKFGYREIKTPMFEQTNLFVRSMGETSDAVKKELYEFKDKGDRDYSLRPELTAGVVRAVVEEKMLANNSHPLKLMYVGSVFRYDRPQKGRYRQFDQVGFELINSNSIVDDVEIILLAAEIMKQIKLNDYVVEINNIGSFESRKK
jgi:histidyl-tRNA synthetase